MSHLLSTTTFSLPRPPYTPCTRHWPFSPGRHFTQLNHPETNICCMAISRSHDNTTKMKRNIKTPRKPVPGASQRARMPTYDEDTISSEILLVFTAFAIIIAFLFLFATWKAYRFLSVAPEVLCEIILGDWVFDLEIWYEYDASEWIRRAGHIIAVGWSYATMVLSPYIVFCITKYLVLGPKPKTLVAFGQKRASIELPQEEEELISKKSRHYSGPRGSKRGLHLVNWESEPDTKKRRPSPAPPRRRTVSCKPNLERTMAQRQKPTATSARFEKEVLPALKPTTPPPIDYDLIVFSPPSSPSASPKASLHPSAAPASPLTPPRMKRSPTDRYDKTREQTATVMRKHDLLD
ncbi:hypothetical protein K402DRAFT_459865 [Aulographum hederae CBS 113979]|uniref:Uncharacterized protein n=1 Tax=Aulographum hederae CBS 113979 TaxID=1176131 RepID=A0A6G1HDN0_9PEZI|nr:hypothetical protein K402DRAFT_459865 [Aulographum hederae CBS 113979]